MRLRHLTPVAALVVAGLVGCGSPGSSTTPNAAGTRGGASASATPTTTTAPGAKATAPAGGAPSASTGTKPGATTAPSSATRPGSKPKPSAAPRSGDAEGVVDPRIQGDAQQVPISAQVTPACVARGGLARLTVKATPKSQMSYVAIYNGEKSGAAKPWGEGYGGNDKGAADHAGNATFTWVVGANAPTGPARVLLVVATGDKQRAINVPFSVSEREADGCGT
jgi:hypothetical protein